MKIKTAASAELPDMEIQKNSINSILTSKSTHNSSNLENNSFDFDIFPKRMQRRHVNI